MNYKSILIIVIVSILSLTCFGMYKTIVNLREEVSTSYTNIKAYVDQNAGLTHENRAFILTLDQYRYYNDSIMIKLRLAQEKLKIKDKNIKALQYLLSSATKTDSIVFRDTIIFRDPSIKVDTLVGDPWFTLRLGLEWPNKVKYKVSFKSEKSIIVSTQRETIKPPKKFFLWRLFQRKHDVAIVDVYEESPYVETQNQRFIEVIK